MSETVAPRARANRVVRAGLWLFSSVVLVTVVTGYFQKPLPDEGAAAHIFQVSIVAFSAAMTVFLATANWRDRRTLRAPGVATLILSAAFAGLYYLEHVFYVTHFH